MRGAKGVRKLTVAICLEKVVAEMGKVIRSAKEAEKVRWTRVAQCLHSNCYWQ